MKKECAQIEMTVNEYIRIQDFHCSKEDGCFIRLKEGFINYFTGDRIIHVEKMQEVRKYITKSHKK